MRCSLIILSFALTLLAAPVPVPQEQALAAEARWIRYSKNGRVTNERDVEEREVLLESRAFHGGKDTREAEPAPGGYRGSQKARAAEAEPAPGGYRGSQKARAAEAEPAPGGYRGSQKARAAEAEPAPGGYRGSQKTRAAEAEPAPGGYRGSQKTRAAEAEPTSRSNGDGRSIVDSAISAVEAIKSRGFSSANAIIEALKSRGFSSASLLEPM